MKIEYELNLHLRTKDKFQKIDDSPLKKAGDQHNYC